MNINPATLQQLKAAAPDRSTWLTANAGSGKTRVLTQRVARLLLAGVEPQRILCLTYTKAAASEMQNRLFAMLGSWAMLDADTLRKELASVGEEGALSADELAHARTLFARAIETPGGLKIQTIHAFCASILRRFPLEAGVSPDFREMDQRLARLIQRDVIEDLASAGSAGFSALVNEHSSDDLSDLLDEILREKQSLLLPKSREDVFARFGLPGDYSWPAHAANFLEAGDDDLLADVARLLEGSGANDQKFATKLRGIDLGALLPSTFAALEEICVFNGKAKAPFTAKIKTVPTKAGRDILGEALTAALHDFLGRMEDAHANRLALVAADRNWALHRFAQDFLPLYEARKADGGWLDFDDLIARTRTLLSDRETAAWVLYRLDGGIDHILVDEAQDTSPAQWDIIKELATEFLAGEGAHSDRGRTVFVVGDKKQSIYSFQGADPRAFDASEAYFARMLADAPDPLQVLPLKYSFRSSPAILEIVDKVFAQSRADALGHESDHIAFKDAMPGRVDLLVPHEDTKPELPAWYEALDFIGEEDKTRRLARDIARRIKDMISRECLPDKDGPRPVRAGDILILVQRRSALFNELIRACKAMDVPLAGADQLNVAQELAVRDITAILSFLATPEDDLALASALKSPLFGWDERALFDLAHYRTSIYLWPALRERSADFPETVAKLQDLLAKADFLRPFDLIERILTAGGGRRAIYARLGPEAEDAVDALLAQALVYEQSEPPSLSGFLTWLAADDLKVKRAIDGSANVVRVMTVHGSKGLEAPIVILPDAAERRDPQQPKLIETKDGPAWLPVAKDRPDMLSEALAQRTERLKDERQRLLYVAMTRAENWLIVGAAGDATDPEKSWHAQISRALDEVATQEIEGGIRYEPLPWPAALSKAADVDTAEEAQFDPPAPPPETTKERVNPSQLGGSKTLPGAEDAEDAIERGSALHHLLEVLPDLPEEDWPAYAEARGGLHPALLPDAASLLSTPELRDIFAPSTLAEVDVTARMPDFRDRVLRGSIDRLVIGEDHVLAVDFKSNRLVPAEASDVPESILRQMGAYAVALAQIYPSKRIETAILWTHTATLMPLSHRSVIEALQRAAPA